MGKSVVLQLRTGVEEVRGAGEVDIAIGIDGDAAARGPVESVVSKLPPPK